MSNPQDDFRAAVMAALGAAPDTIEPGKLHRFSINGKRADTAGWCQLFDDGLAGTFGDFRAGLSLVWTATRGDRMTPAERAHLARTVAQAQADRQQAQQQARQAQVPRLAALWAACRPVAADGTGNDPVTLYLRYRLALAHGDALAVPDVIRLHPGLAYHHEGQHAGTWPAMVAGLQGHDGVVVALHRTWLTQAGRKAPTPGPCKKLTPAAGRITGGCIRLAWPGDGAADVLGIAEGIETALAARQASGLPTVAAYSGGAMATWQWPPDMRRLVIFADHDKAGRDAADTLRARALAARLQCEVLTPTEPGTDWADVWAARLVGAAA